ncbi:MAG: carboxypeptidase regulatory-like domain-containing protein, partial [Euryarchaeota archaeon]|nr:carboxypeptidase regulatory-like domain-containing protein [Euryarchaeota archaeon]
SDPNAGSSSQYAPAGADAASGLQATAQTVANNAPSPAVGFKLPALAQDYYLNVSKPVVGMLYWTSQIATTLSATQPAEAAQVRIELYAGTRRIGGDEAPYVPYYTQDAKKAWQPLPILFRPETRLLLAGEPLTLRVTRISSWSDFVVGTGGDHQTWVELRYFDFDPLSGNAYLENGRLLLDAPTGDEGSGEFLDRAEVYVDAGGLDSVPTGPVFLPAAEHGNAAFGLSAVVLPLGGLAVARVPRRAKRAGAVAFLVLAVGLAGCLGGGSTVVPNEETEEPSPTVETRYTDEPELEKGTGAVEGVVRDGDAALLPIGGAHVSFLGTNLFGATDKTGRFAFESVAEGTYRLRVDAPNFLPAEEDVTIQAGKRALLNITLYHPATKQANDKAHLHDEWGDETSKVLLDGRISLQSTQVKAAVPGGNPCVGNAVDCFGSIILPPDVSVPPGAVELEVVLNWAATGNAPKELALRVTTTTNKTGSLFVARGPNDPFRIAFFPNEADPGHQRFTSWTFDVTARPYFLTYHLVHAAAAYVMPEVGVKVIAHKGVVPYEPPHADRWGGADAIELVNDKAGVSFTGIATKLPAATVSWTPLKTGFVPPGTKEITGKVTWTPYNGIPTTVDWTLLARPANVPPADSEGELLPVATSPTTNGFTFALTPKPEHVDQFYQSVSNWQFYVDDKQNEAASGTGVYNNLGGYGTKFFLEATSHRDPEYKAS